MSEVDRAGRAVPRPEARHLSREKEGESGPVSWTGPGGCSKPQCDEVVCCVSVSGCCLHVCLNLMSRTRTSRCVYMRKHKPQTLHKLQPGFPEKTLDADSSRD